MPLLENLLGRIRDNGVASEILRVSARPADSETARGSDSLDALLERVMALPARPSTQRAPSPSVGQSSHAFVPGSAVLTMYVSAAR